MGGVRIDLSDKQIAELRFLVGYGYADGEAGVARYLIERGLDDLRRASVIPPYCDCGAKAREMMRE